MQGLSSSTTFIADQHFYPYAPPSPAAPGVYSISTAPFLDQDGLEFSISPAAPLNGNAPGVGVQYPVANVWWTPSQSGAFLTEGLYTNAPIAALQKQIYTL